MDTGLTITSPADGSTVIPGESITVTVQPDAGVDLDTLMLASWSELQERNAAPWTFTVDIPEAAVGPFPIAATGRDSDDTLHHAAITLNVEPDVPLQVLDIDPANVVLTEAGLIQDLVVEGIYQDDTRRDLTGAATGTGYQSSDPAVVTVDANGRLQGQGNGNATVTVTNGPATAYITVVVRAETDLGISHTEIPDPVQVDQTFSYNLNVQNQGNERALDVQVTDTLPAGAGFVDATGTGWFCIEAGGIVTCNRDALEAGAASAITLTVYAPDTPGVVTNRATVDAGSMDAFVNDNVTRVTTTVTEVGNPIDYTLTVTSPAGGTVTGDGIHCGSGGSDCAQSYPEGTSVTLTATPDSGWRLSDWGGACASDSATCDLIMDTDRLLSVTFEEVSVPTPEQIGVFRRKNRTFYLDANGNGVWDGREIDRVIRFGNRTDRPVTGDWNGDGIDEVGVFRPARRAFYLDANGNGSWDGRETDQAIRFGIGSDLPVAGHW